MDCDYCKERKGRNKQIVHILSRPSRIALVEHLKSVFGENSYRVSFFTNLWDSAHLVYRYGAELEQVPLWLIYLEAHGVKVTNREQAVLRYRAKHGQTEIVYGPE